MVRGVIDGILFLGGSHVLVLLVFRASVVVVVGGGAGQGWWWCWSWPGVVDKKVCLQMWRGDSTWQAAVR